MTIASPGRTGDPPTAEIEAALRREIGELTAALNAILTGGIDAVIIPGPHGDALYTLSSADRPYRVIVEGMWDGAATISERGILLYANQRFADLLGLDRATLLGRDFTDLMQAGDPAILDGLLATGPGATAHAELTILHPGGAPIPVLASVTGLDLDGVVVRCLIVADLTSRVEAEEHRTRERAAERRRYEELFESEVVGITRTTPDGRILQTNRAAARMFGFDSPEELVAQTPHVRSLYADSVRRPLLMPDDKGQEMKPGELELRRRDGSTFFSRGGARRIRDSNGEVTEYLSLFIDITERIALEREARENLARYRAISEMTNDFPCSVLLYPDGSNQLEWATESLERAVGYSIEQINALGGLSALLDPEELPRVLEEYVPSVLAGMPIKAELTFLTKSSGRLVVEAHGQLQDEDPAPPRRVLVGMSDVTERHMRLEALRLSRQRIERILSLTPAVIFVVEGTEGADDWTPTFMSGNIQDLFGYDEDRFREGVAFWREIVYPDDRDFPLAPQAATLQEGRYQAEYRFRHGDGSLHWLNEQLSVVRSDHGPRAEVIGSWTDITTSRATAEALQLADQQLQELMVKLSTAHEEERAHLSRELHDNLGQLLTSASLFAKAASHDLPPDSGEQLDRVRSLIDDALASTRSLAWTLRRSEQSVELEGRLERLIADVGSSNSTEMNLEFRGHGRSVSVGVESVVFRIVQEAITNVLRHAQARHAWVIVTLTGDQVGVVVKDDGVGFDPQSTGTWMDRAGLLGMEERANALGGTLKIDSRPGWGTTVQFDLSSHEANP